MQEKDKEGGRQKRQFPIKHFVIHIIIPGMSLEACNRRERRDGDSESRGEKRGRNSEKSESRDKRKSGRRGEVDSERRGTVKGERKEREKGETD